jgi:hypothetical protein
MGEAGSQAYNFSYNQSTPEAYREDWEETSSRGKPYFVERVKQAVRMPGSSRTEETNGVQRRTDSLPTSQGQGLQNSEARQHDAQTIQAL